MFTLEPLKSEKLPEFSSLNSRGHSLAPDSELPGDAVRSEAEGGWHVSVRPTVPEWLQIQKEFKKH